MRSFRTKVCDGGASSVVSPPDRSATAVPEVINALYLFRVRSPNASTAARQCVEPLRSPFRSREYMQGATHCVGLLSCRRTSRLAALPRTGVAPSALNAHPPSSDNPYTACPSASARSVTTRPIYPVAPVTKYPHFLPVLFWMDVLRY